MNDSIKVIDNDVEVITLDLIREITDYQKNYKDGAVNIAVRTDETIETVMERKPLKKLSDRIMLAKSIKGVDSVTVVDNKGVLAFEPTSDDLNSAHIKKKYKVGYVPGTFDIVHPGHLEIIKIATMYCEKVVVGINADNLVWENKKKKCMQNESTRMFIMRHIKGVEHVILVEENDKCKANEIIKMLTGEEIGCIFYGEDLRAKKNLMMQAWKVLIAIQNILADHLKKWQLIQPVLKEHNFSSLSLRMKNLRMRTQLFMKLLIKERLLYLLLSNKLQKMTLRMKNR